MRVSETSQSKPRASQPVIELTEAEPIAERKNGVDEAGLYHSA
jgi:hypothetical protein